MRLFMLLLVGMLTGCETTSPPPAAVLLSDDKQLPKLMIPDQLLELCQPLSNLKENPTLSEVIDQKEADVRAYVECSDKHRSLAKLVKEFLKE